MANEYPKIIKEGAICMRCKEPIPIGSEVSKCLGALYHTYGCTNKIKKQTKKFEQVHKEILASVLQ